MDYQRLKRVLDNLYNTFDFRNRVLHDPVEFPHRYSEARDIEVSGFIASVFAYGRVELFRPVIDKILTLTGKSPADFIANFDPRKDSSRFSGIKYRFNDTIDILCLFYVLSNVLRRFGSIESSFLQFYDGQGVFSAITGFVNYLKSLDKSPVYGISATRNPSSPERKGFLQLIPSPEKGSSCKRMNLFMRWMVRDRDIDFGLWKGIPGNLLVIPLDTHIARISRCLGLTGRKSQDWKTAVEITENLKRLDPEDPLKYDFALCHQGITGLCREGVCGKKQSLCPVINYYWKH